MKVLVTYNIPRESFAKLGKEHTITMPEGEYFTTEELIKLVPDYDVILRRLSPARSITPLSKPEKS